MGRIVLRDDHQAAAQFIQAVHDSRSHRVSGFDRPQMMQQRIDQRARANAGSDMAHHARGLVDDGEIPVLVNHRNR